MLHRTGTDPAVAPADVRPGSDGVTITGDVVELVMHGFGRSEAHVTVTGSDAAVAAYEGARRGL